MKFARETPSISNMATSNTAYCGSDLISEIASTASPFLNTWAGTTTGGTGGAGGLMAQALGARGDYEKQLADMLQRQQAVQTPPATSKGSKTSENFMGRRLVQVFITDPDEKVPLESCLLYSGQQRMTDLTDNELFFEIDIKSVLDTHNALRAKIVDKTVKDRTQYLEPTRVSKLKMVVVNVATF